MISQDEVREVMSQILQGLIVRTPDYILRETGSPHRIYNNLTSVFKGWLLFLEDHSGCYVEIRPSFAIIAR